MTYLRPKCRTADSGWNAVQPLLTWAASNLRSLPWRESKKPYELAVAEILLQKTRAVDVLPVWSDLLEKYPTADSLMEAPEAEIQERVGHLGLGAQRAGRLRVMASALAESGDWKSSPGIGTYAKAVIALTLGQEGCLEPPVDGNIARLITRFHGFHFEKGEARKKREVRDAVSEFLNGAGDAGGRRQLLYALLDVGDSVCTPNRPSCGVCPLRDACRYASTSGES